MWATTAIGTSNTTLSPTVATGTQWVSDWITCHNTNASASVTVTWYLVNNGGAAGSTMQMHQHTLLAGESKIPDGVRGHVLVAGESIVAIASATGVNTRASGRLQSTS